MSARLRNGLTLHGGTSAGRISTNTCAVRSALPEFTLTNAFCDVTRPMLTTVKGIGSYLIPKIDVQLSATFSSLPGVQLTATRIYTTAEVAQSLGRPLSSNQANVTVNLLPSETVYGDRATDTDIRIAKIFRFGRTRSNLAFDLVNAFNSDAVLGSNGLINATWPTPTSVLQAAAAGQRRDHGR